MYLPEAVSQCLQALEDAGFPCYAVGGCVRDAVLGLTPHDYDLCTAARPEQIKAVFAHRPLVLAGEKHGTVGVVTPDGVVEITTYRTEGDYQDNRHPGWVEFVDRIEDDLARRDFTVNAMAWSPVRGFADPFGGREDLKNRILRAVGHADTRFREDSLRILRGIRFAVRYDLTPEKETYEAMHTLSPLMDHLARERVFDELCKLLPTLTADTLLRFAPILTQVLPEIGPMMGFQQHSPHHAYDVFTHTAHVVASVPCELTLRWAALLHDTGKVTTFTRDETGRGHFYGHAQASAAIANQALLRLRASNELRQQVVFLIEQHMTPILPQRKALRRQLSKWGEKSLRQLLMLQKADYFSKGVPGEPYPFDEIDALLEQLVAENACLTIKDLAVSGHDLMAQGITGTDIGRTLNALLEQVVDETLPNEKEALLSAIHKEDTL